MLATGVQSESLVQAYLSGKFHILLLQETASEDFRRTLRTYQFSFVDAEEESLLLAIGGTGHHHLEVLRAGHVQNEGVTNPAEVATQNLHSLIVRIGWKDSEGDFVNRAGSRTWVACTLPYGPPPRCPSPPPPPLRNPGELNPPPPLILPGGLTPHPVPNGAVSTREEPKPDPSPTCPV